MPLRILLVDDHTMLRAGIKAILEHDLEFTVVGEAGNGAEAIEACQHNPPDIIVMDIGLPDMNGIEATQVILRHVPDMKVVVLSIYDDEQTVVNAIRTGAQAFVLKNASGTDLLEALRTVAKGGFYLSPQLSDHLLEGITRAVDCRSRLGRR
jgi:two-component system, NarL family, response regulator DegU